MRRLRIAVLLGVTVIGTAVCEDFAAKRFGNNPLVSVDSSKSLGDNINGPSVIRVPDWVHHPLGRYYLYFAHHKGSYIRLAYANSLSGPWRVYEPGVLQGRDTAFWRPGPDPPGRLDLYTHVASPDVFIDEPHKRLVMWVHGMWTDGRAWPPDASTARQWLRDNGYGQYTQTAVSEDGVHFQVQPRITAKVSYLRAFLWKGQLYGMGRLGVLARAEDVLGRFEVGPSAFSSASYSDRVRHVALLVRGDTLYVFFSGIGDSPERIMLSTVALRGDWRTWRASTPKEVIAPREKYECVDRSVEPSKPGESEGPERALRDPAIYEEGGKVLLFYSVCGEQGIGAADVTSFFSLEGPGTAK